METFSVLLAFCAENSPVIGEFPSQRPVTRSFDVSHDLGLNQQMSKQWRRHRAHYDVLVMLRYIVSRISVQFDLMCLSTLVQVVASRRTGNKSLPMMTQFTNAKKA